VFLSEEVFDGDSALSYIFMYFISDLLLVVYLVLPVFFD